MLTGLLSSPTPALFDPVVSSQGLPCGAPKLLSPKTPFQLHPTIPPVSMDHTDAVSLHKATQALEANLKALMRARPGEIGEIETQRNQIRDNYRRLLFLDPVYASGKEVEQSLWKVCYYKRIEEFRKRIRKIAAAASSNDKASAGKARAELHAVCTDFSSFIGDSINFYTELMTAFEAMHRQQQSSRRVRRNSAGGAATASEAAAPEHDCLKSIHRCLIFLGDLARYRELHSENARKDWSQAERWYYAAIDVMPSSGNPHNQLAVLATYTEAECVAVYRYCRALLCELPFPTAKENLTLLFEKNRQNMADPWRSVTRTDNPLGVAPFLSAASDSPVVAPGPHGTLSLLTPGSESIGYC
jgi:hypothetical protein